MKMGLNKKLLLSIVALVAFTSIIVTVSIIYKIQSVLEKQVVSQLNAKVEQYHSTIDALYKGTLSGLDVSINVIGEDVNNETSNIDNSSLVSTTIINQVSKESKEVEIPMLTIDGQSVFKKYGLVDKLAKMTSSAVTIFQLVDEGLLRVSTNIVKNNGERATGTFIPTDSPVYKKIVSGEDFYGRAYVVNEWYLTIYRPLINNGKVIGAVFVGKAESNLKEIKDEIRSKKIGKTGYAYIVDKSGKVIVHHTIEGKNISQTKGARGKVFFKDLIKTKSGISNYYWKKKDGSGNDKKTVSFKHFDKMNWIIVVGMDHGEVFAPLSDVKLVTFISSIIATILSVLIGIYLQKSFSKAMGRATNVLGQNSEKIDHSVEKLFLNSKELDTATERQKVSLDQTYQNIENIRSEIEGSDHSISNVVETSKKSIVVSNTGQEAVKRMILAIEEIKSTNDNVITSVDDSSNKMNEVTNVISQIAEKANIINDIVFQTKLLSFNASVEAARAGENGKGFAVVAEEVGNLASLSGKSADEIQSLLTEGIDKVNQLIQENKNEMSRITTLSSEKIELGIAVANECEFALLEIVSNIQESNSLAKTVRESSKEQLSKIRIINEDLSELKSLADMSSQISGQTSESAKELVNGSDELKGLISSINTLLNG